MLELSTPAWWLLLAALLSVIAAGLLWGFLGRVTSTVSAPSMVIARTMQDTAGSRGAPRLTLVAPSDVAQSIRPGMHATFSAEAPQGSAPRDVGGSVRAVRVVSWDLGWPIGGSSTTITASPVAVAMITLAPSSTAAPSSLPAPGVTGAADIVTRERRPISLVVP